MGATQARTRREPQGAVHWAIGKGHTLPGDCGVPQRPRNYFWGIAVSFLLSEVCQGYLDRAILRFPAIVSAAKTKTRCWALCYTNLFPYSTLKKKICSTSS